jgi:hypothetical protein
MVLLGFIYKVDRSDPWFWKVWLGVTMDRYTFKPYFFEAQHDGVHWGIRHPHQAPGF